MCVTANTTRQFNPIPLMIILFTLSFAMLKLLEFNPFDFSWKSIWTTLMFWFATAGHVGLCISLFLRWLHKQLAKLAHVFVSLYMAVFIVNWLDFFHPTTVPASPITNPVVASYIYYVGLFYFLVLAFFAVVRWFRNFKKLRWVAFLTILAINVIAYLTYHDYVTVIVLLLYSIPFLAFALGWNPPDYFPV